MISIWRHTMSTEGPTSKPPVDVNALMALHQSGNTADANKAILKGTEAASSTSLGSIDSSYKADKPPLQEHKWTLLTGLSNLGGAIKTAALNLATSVSNLWNKLFNKQDYVIDVYSNIESEKSSADASEEDLKSALYAAEGDLSTVSNEIDNLEAERNQPASRQEFVRVGEQFKSFHPKLQAAKNEANPEQRMAITKAESELNEIVSAAQKNPSVGNLQDMQSKLAELTNLVNKIPRR